MTLIPLVRDNKPSNIHSDIILLSILDINPRDFSFGFSIPTYITLTEDSCPRLHNFPYLSQQMRF